MGRGCFYVPRGWRRGLGRCRGSLGGRSYVRIPILRLVLVGRGERGEVAYWHVGEGLRGGKPLQLLWRCVERNIEWCTLSVVSARSY